MAFSEESVTNIILINRQAELVEMNLEGEIIKRYLAIPDYFSSGKSHSRNLRESLNAIKDYGQIEPNYFLPFESSLPDECLQSTIAISNTTETEENIAKQHLDQFISEDIGEEFSTKYIKLYSKSTIGLTENLENLFTNINNQEINRISVDSGIQEKMYFQKQHYEVTKRFPRDDNWYHQT